MATEATPEVTITARHKILADKWGVLPEEAKAMDDAHKAQRDQLQKRRESIAAETEASGTAAKKPLASPVAESGAPNEPST